MGSCITCEEGKEEVGNAREPYPSIEDVICRREAQKKKRKKKNGSVRSKDSKQR